jgi:hypothetical protein
VAEMEADELPDVGLVFDDQHAGRRRHRTGPCGGAVTVFSRVVHLSVTPNPSNELDRGRPRNGPPA